MTPARLSASDQKRNAILEAATKSFLRVGFADTNLDEVAAAAGASKVTVYSHFSSKEGLFIAVVDRVIAERSATGPRLDAEQAAIDLGATLLDIATDLIATVRDPAVVRLRRVLIAEQARHPTLAAAWRTATVVATTEELTAFFRELQERGMMRRFDPSVWAAQFLWMLIGEPLDAGLMDPRASLPPVERTAEFAVETLLRASRPD
jgi:TetR/AcrR family transcriptional repressor of mexJK operon